jgi:hypothetical protein
MHHHRTRATASIVLVIVGGVFLFIGAIALYAREEIIDQNAFADRAVTALDDDGVRHLVSRELVANVIDRGSTDLVSARPLLESVVDATIQTAAFRKIFRQAAYQTNRVFFVRDRKNALFDLGDAAQVVRFGLQSVSPQLAKQIPRDLNAQLLSIKRSEFAGQTLSIADHLRIVGILLPALSLVAFVGAVAVAPDRRIGVLLCGVAVGAVGALIAIALIIIKARTLAGVHGEDELTNQEVRDGVSGVFDAYLGDLVTWSLLTALVGLVVAGAAAALQPEDVESPIVMFRRRLFAQPRTWWGKALHGTTALALGIAVVLNPWVALQITAIALGAYLVFFGASELLVLLQRSGQSAAAGEARRKRVLVAAGGAATVVVAGLVAVILLVTGGGGGQSQAATGTDRCNGSRALCALPLNQVVFAGTHNSFSAADSPGWYIANQRRTVSRQLRDGIRLFLIDPHWGVESNGQVRTDFHAEARDRNRVAKSLPPDILRAAERLVGRIGSTSTDGPPDVWLCHSVCELGATKMVDVLVTIRQFLDRHRGEVVILFIEPYVPPKDIAARFDRAGLTRYVTTLRRDEPLPTLGQLVRRDKRVIVFTENDADGTVPWYLNGFLFVQDTPLGATKTSQLSCKRYRGGTDSPLLMLNHWADLFPPKLTANRPFQRKQFILNRAHKCAKLRGLPVNMIAVDYYDQGALIPAVKELNRERIEANRRSGQ